MLKSCVPNKTVRNILAVYAPILHAAIQDGGKFFSRSSAHEFKNVVPMTAPEVEAWMECFNVSGIINSEKLYIPTAETQEPNGYRINLEEVKWMRIGNFDYNLDRLQYYLQSYVYFGGHGNVPNQIYNAFLSLNVYAKDERGRWIVRQIPGTGNANWNRPVFHPLCIASMGVWFNTNIDIERGNLIKVNYDKPNGIMFGIEIHKLEDVQSMEVLDNDRLRLFFWQLNQRRLPMPFESMFTEEQGFVCVRKNALLQVRQRPVSLEAQSLAGQKVLVVSSVEKDSGLVQVMPISVFACHSGVSVTIPFCDLVTI